jgi:UDP-N-acetylmuramate dehydrogenase
VEKILKKISQNLNSKIYFDYDTSKNVWFKAGGKAMVFCLVYDLKELQIILNSINIKEFPYEVIGAGSNFLVRDSGFKGIIFKLGKNFNKINLKNSSVEVGAGILDINLSKFAKINNIKNFEFYSGIPGTIGGAIRMNAGCYGSETKDILQKITTINSIGKINTLTKDKLKLSYRDSKIPKGHIIISANYDCVYGNKEEIIKRIDYIKIMREKSQPINLKTSGSTFKNPKNNHAAKLIEMADCKGMNVGDVWVSDKHANFLINKNKVSASQIEELGKIIIDKVFDKFNIKLEWEVKIIG